jgi:thiol-disulfide isomerase/thioredoxin
MRRLVILLGLLALAPTAVADADVNLDELRGTVVLLDFWASWCVPCRRSFPWMNAMHEKYADEGLVIIAVNVDKKTAAANEFLEAYPANFRIAYDPDAILAREYGVEAMPSTFIIGRDGQITSRHVGFKVKRQEEYEAAIESALEAETSK